MDDGGICKVEVRSLWIIESEFLARSSGVPRIFLEGRICPPGYGSLKDSFFVNYFMKSIKKYQSFSKIKTNLPKKPQSTSKFISNQLNHQISQHTQN